MASRTIHGRFTRVCGKTVWWCSVSYMDVELWAGVTVWMHPDFQLEFPSGHGMFWMDYDHFWLDYIHTWTKNVHLCPDGLTDGYLLVFNLLLYANSTWDTFIVVVSKRAKWKPTESAAEFKFSKGLTAEQQTSEAAWRSSCLCPQRGCPQRGCGSDLSDCVDYIYI